MQHLPTLPNRIFATTNVFLERFLYAHKIRFFRQVRLPDRMTRWFYYIDTELVETLNEFYKIYGEPFEYTEERSNENEA